MELVAAMKRHHVEELLDELDREEMPSAVQEHAAIGEARLVGNRDERQFYLLTGLSRRRKRLPKRLGSTEQACWLESRDENAVLANRQRITFLLLLRQGSRLCLLSLLGRRGKSQPDGRFLCFRSQSKLQPYSFLNPRLQERRNAGTFAVRRIVGNAHAACQGKELGGVRLNFLWKGDDVVVGTLCRSTDKRYQTRENEE